MDGEAGGWWMYGVILAWVENCSGCRQRWGLVVAVASDGYDGSLCWRL